MEFIVVVGLILGGALAASSLIAKKNADAGEAIKKLAPYQSWIGLFLLGWGLFAFIFRFLLWMRYWSLWLRFAPVMAITYIVGIIVSILLGLVLSMNFLKSREEIPQEKLEKLEKKLTPIQVPLGIVAIVDAVILLIARFARF